MTDHPLESTATLIRLLQDGEADALERLVTRCMPLLRQWARGRLPAYGRDLSDTDDIVQVTLMRAINNLDHFEQRREGAFLAYLRSILMNVVRDEIRRTSRKPLSKEADEAIPDSGHSALDAIVGRQTVEAYETALVTLTDEQREAVILRVEFGMSFAEVAVELGLPSEDAARMRVSRGLVKLAEAMS
ncbi:MAG: sigma-70 family RNA polymerase sigma factor [Thermoanaerobaculia bacterium]|nr:sigma-70 family RNA polymerase sigma factor [Thermoanaerobaculia bacterium]